MRTPIGTECRGEVPSDSIDALETAGFDAGKTAAAFDSKARLEFALDCAGVGIWDWDLTTGAIVYSPIAKAICGFPHDDDVTHEQVRGVVHKDDLPATTEQSQRAMDPTVRDRTPFEYRIVRLDGEIRWVLAQGQAVFEIVDGEERAVRFLGTIQDVTEQRQTKEAELATDRRLALAIEAGRMAIWDIDLTTDEITGSPELYRLFGFPENHLPSVEAMRARYAPGERERLNGAAKEAMARGDRFIEAEFRYVWPDASLRCLLLRCEILFDDAKRPLKAVGVIADITDRKQAEEALRTSEARLALAQQAAKAGVWDWDLSTGRLHWGPEIYAFYGIDLDLPHDKLFGAWVDAVEPDDRASAEQTALRAASHGESFSMDFRTRASDGDVRWVRSQGTVVLDDQGRPARVVGINLDVSDQHRREDRLRAKTEILESAVAERTRERDRLWQNSRDMFAVIDAQGAFKAVSPAATKILGYASSDMIGLNVLDFIHPDDQAATVDALEQAAKTASPIFENRYRHRDGTYRWISWVAAPDGDIIYATGRHITSEKETAEALARSEARMRSIFETSYQYQGLLALDGTLLDANKTSLAAIGAGIDDVLGQRFWDTPWFAATPDMPEAIRDAIATVAQGASVQQELLLNLPSGWRSFDFSLRPVRNDAGEVVALVLEAVDITERRQAEDALRQSQKLEAMGQPTGGVAHDFNNLLTPIIGSLDMLQRRGLGSEREQRLVGGALQSAERAKTLVQRLLAFARRQPLQANAVDLCKLVTEMSDLIASTSGPQIKVVIAVPNDLPPALADANQLEMALLNLGVNARDAMPAGGTLTISVASETIGLRHPSKLRPGSYLRLSVADTGVGMDEATVARAIEPFFSTKGVGQGTGLGLSMVHGLASQLGGALTIKSRPDVGTCIDLWLPRSEAAPINLRPDPEAIADHFVGTVLLVDDEELVRASTADMLADLGFSVVEAPSAAQALKLIADGLYPDVLVTDHLMPGMTGTELAYAIGIDRPELPVLVVSGYAESKGISPDLARLTKPFRAADLARSLRGILSEVCGVGS